MNVAFHPLFGMGNAEFKIRKTNYLNNFPRRDRDEIRAKYGLSLIMHLID